MVVARERSFTRAAAQLGVSQSALSHAMRHLETRLDVRLLTRTTRSVVPTSGRATDSAPRSASGRDRAGPAALRDTENARRQPAHYRREHAASAVLWPALKPFMLQYPDINIEITVDNGLTDIVGDRFDAGVRLGEQVAKDMIAVRIARICGWRWWVRRPICSGPVRRKRPGSCPTSLHQSAPADTRDFTHGNLPAMAGRFRCGWRTADPQQPAAAHRRGGAGLGLAYVPDDCVAEALASGRLVRVLAEWTPPSRLPSLPQPAPAYQRFHAVTGNSATLISINLSNAR